MFVLHLLNAGKHCEGVITSNCDFDIDVDAYLAK